MVRNKAENGLGTIINSILQVGKLSRGERKLCPMVAKGDFAVAKATFALCPPCPPPP